MLQSYFESFLSRLSIIATRQHGLVLAAIVLFGTLLRLYATYAGQGYHAFAINDEIEALQQALAWLAGEDKAQYLGQPAFAQGKLPGPLWTLLWVLFYKLGGDSVTGVIYGMALLNSATIYLVYLLARQFLSGQEALLSCFLFAIAPWAIFYSPGVWNPLVLAFLGALLLLALWRVVVMEQSKSIFWVCLVSAAILQFHMIGIFYAPAILLIFYLQSTTLNWRWFFLGIAAGLALYVPYLVGDLQHDWANTRSMLAGSGHEGSYGVVKILTAPLTMLSSIPGRWLGETYADGKILGNALFGSYILLLGFALLTLINAMSYVGHFVYKMCAVLKQEGFSLKRYFASHRELAFISIMLVVPLLLFTLTKHNYASRYSIIIFPLLFLLPVFFLKNRKSEKTRRFWAANILFVSLVNIYMVVSYHHFLATQIEDGEKFIASFNKLETVRKVLRQHAGKDIYLYVQLTGEVNDIVEIDRKTKAAIFQYLAVYQYYISKVQQKGRSRTCLLMPSNSPLDKQHQFVYKNSDSKVQEMGRYKNYLLTLSNSPLIKQYQLVYKNSDLAILAP